MGSFVWRKKIPGGYCWLSVFLSGIFFISSVLPIDFAYAQTVFNLPTPGEGFVPVIINVTPVNLPQLLGFDADEKASAEQLSSLK